MLTFITEEQQVFDAERTPDDAPPPAAITDMPAAGGLNHTAVGSTPEVPPKGAVECTPDDVPPEAQKSEVPSPDETALCIKDPDATPKSEGSADAPYERTHFGLADRFVDLHGQDIRYCHALGRWLVWDGRRFALDTSGRIQQLAKQTIRAIPKEAAVADKDIRRAALKWAKRCQSSGPLSAMIRFAAMDERVRVDKDSLDADEWLLNCHSGTIDLKTGILREHRREDLITKVSPVNYDCDAQCPRFLAFLERIMGNNQNLVSFLQRAIGYSLTGSTKEQVLFFCVGSGANGKSTLLDFATKALGDYAQWADDRLLTVRNGDGPRNDLAGLEGAHMVVTAETAEDARLNEAGVKIMTGGDTLISRRLYKEFTAQRVTYKIWLSTNKKPVIKGSDYAIWRRIMLIPFGVTIPQTEQDKELSQTLLAELPGFLAWAVRGCMEWQKIGLCPPDEVMYATKEYKEESDVLQEFLEECCTVDQADQHLWVLNSELHSAYRKYCLQNSHLPKDIMPAAVFGKALTERGFPKGKMGGQRCRLGIAFKEEAD
jgi:putative DNA primase/helicase